MTRARKTLTLAMLEDRQTLLRHLPETSAVIRRARVDPGPPPPELSRQYRRLELREIDLGFAGRYAARYPIHSAIARMQPGDRVELRQEGDRLELIDVSGNVIGRLSQGFSLPAGTKCIGGSVAAILVRKAEDEKEGYKGLVNTGQWEIIVPELVFA